MVGFVEIWSTLSRSSLKFVGYRRDLIESSLELDKISTDQREREREREREVGVKDGSFR